MENLITVTGSLASIVGAVWALRAARTARSAAEAAKQMRDELVQRRRAVEVSQVHAETRRILSAVSVVGPSCNGKLLRGVDCAAIARAVEEYVRFLLERSEYFSNPFANDAKALCGDLREDIEALSEAVTFEDKKTSGKSIYYKIQAFMPAAKQLSDETRERVARD